MQSEIDSQETLRPVQILGVNFIGAESGNDSTTSGRHIPWLQPVANEDIWAVWTVTYRDVVILGPGNEHIGTYNLTVHNLADADNYAALMAQLLEAADE